MHAKSYFVEEACLEYLLSNMLANKRIGNEDSMAEQGGRAKLNKAASK